MMVGQTPQQPHSDTTINWPVTLDGCLKASRGKIDQYEFNFADESDMWHFFTKAGFTIEEYPHSNILEDLFSVKLLMRKLPVLLAQGYLTRVSKGAKPLGRPHGQRHAVRNKFTRG